MSKSNLEAYHYNQDMLAPLLKISSPLINHLGINYFRYMRIYEDGKYLTIGTNLEYTKYYLENIKNLGGVFKPIVVGASQDKYDFFLWPDQINSSLIKQDSALGALHAHNIWNGLSVYKSNNEYVESWNFAGSRETTELKGFFINNQKLIIDYINYFQKNAGTLIDCSGKSKLASFNSPLPLQQKVENLIEGIQDFNMAIQIARAPKLLLNLGNASLSIREAECLKWVAKGKTMKEIAKLLNISSRTVEYYLNNIKLKTKLNYKSDLIKLYYETTEIYTG